jgi:hypothetical protein
MTAPSLRDRVEWLEARIAGALPPFDFPGPLVISSSDLWCPPNGLSIGRFVWTLASASTAGAVQVGLFLNTVLADTVNIPALTSVYNAPLTSVIVLSGGVDTLTVRILSPGTGAAGLLGTPAVT